MATELGALKLKKPTLTGSLKDSMTLTIGQKAVKERNSGKYPYIHTIYGKLSSILHQGLYGI